MLRKHKSYIGMAIAVAALVVAMVVSFQRMTVLQDRATVEARAALWLLSQLETEFLRFRETVTAYYAGDAQTDRRILDARFDILWSRLPLFLEGAESAALRDLEGLTQTVEMLLMTLHDLEPAVIALRPGNTMAYNEIVAGLEPFDEPLSDLSVRAYHQSAWYVNLRDDRTLLARIETAAAFIAIILGVGIFIYLLTRQMGRTESLLANTIAAQRSARASERRFKDVAEAASDWFWETDSQLCFTYISDRYRQITEKSGVEMIGKRREDIYRDALEADRDAWNGYFAKTAAQEDFRDFVHADLNNPNQLRVLRNSGKAIFDEQGHFTGYRGTSTDVSSEVEAREAAEAAKEQLGKAQKMQAVGQLTGGITHDFNNLLSVISGNAAILKKNLDGPDETLQAIIGAADRGADLTRRLRTFSRHQPLDPVAVDIDILITETAPMLRRTLGGTIEIETRLGEGPIVVLADKSQLENAILNLAINARDAMADGGRLTISARKLGQAEEGLPEELLGAGEGFVLLSIADRGCGMTEEVLEHALEPFFTTKAVGLGSGLGLSMVYGFISQTGGHLEIDSRPDEGTEVHCYLPQPGKDYVPHAEKTPADLQAPAGDGETILVVEDDPDVRALTAKLLDLLGYHVISAASAAAALEALEAQEKIDLVISDIVLAGGRSGLDVGRAALEKADGPGLLFMSGYADEELEKGGELMRDVELLNKPFRMEELAQKVRLALDEKKA